MLRVVHIRNKKRSNKHWILQTWSIVSVAKLTKSAGETAKKVLLLSVIWNLMLIEMQLSQLRISDNKREKVCAVRPYLLLYLVSDTEPSRGMRCNEDSKFKVCHVPSQGLMKYTEWDGREEMVEWNLWQGKTRETQTLFRPHGNPRGVSEMRGAKPLAP